MGDNSDSDNESYIPSSGNNKISKLIGKASTYFDDSSSDDESITGSDVDFEGGAGSDKDIEEGEIDENENIENNKIDEGDEDYDNVNDDDDDDDEDNDIDDHVDEVDENIMDEEIKNTVSAKIKKSKVTSKTIQLPVDEDYDDEDDDEEYNENYLQKFDNEISKNYVDEFHPECLIHNYDEISKLSTVVKDNFGIIIDPLHKTIPYLTKYEKARIIGQRAKQIENGAKPFVKVPENIIDGYIIAELELQQKILPFIIRRPIPGGGCEYWNIKDLEIISF